MVKNQMALPKEHAHTPFLTQMTVLVGNLGFQNMTCACSLGYEICVFTFRMNFELRGWPSQPLPFSSNSTKITKNAQF